jgi:hypothetical protein
LCSNSTVPVSLTPFCLSNDQIERLRSYIKRSGVFRPPPNNRKFDSSFGKDIAGIHNRESLPFFNYLKSYVEVIQQFNIHGRCPLADFDINESSLSPVNAETNDIIYDICDASHHLFDAIQTGKSKHNENVLTILNTISGRKRLNPYIARDLYSISFQQEVFVVDEIVESERLKSLFNSYIDLEKKLIMISQKIAEASTKVETARATCQEVDIQTVSNDTDPIDNWEDLLDEPEIVTAPVETELSIAEREFENLQIELENTKSLKSRSESALLNAVQSITYSNCTRDSKKYFFQKVLRGLSPRKRDIFVQFLPRDYIPK